MLLTIASEIALNPMRREKHFQGMPWGIGPVHEPIHFIVSREILAREHAGKAGIARTRKKNAGEVAAKAARVEEE